AIFYEALRARFPELNPLTMPERSRTGQGGIYEAFRTRFEHAMRATGDYEPIFFPQVEDWAGSLIFASEEARQGWKGVLQNLAHYDFRQIPFDIVGGIFQRLIAPEERQKFGQYFTNEDIVDLINAFCIHRGGDVVLDPACGSGSFLVRAYHRKAWLARQGRRGRHQDFSQSHQELLTEIFGCDIAVFAAHLATLNLAARHIEEEENYPCIARRNFFEVPDQRKSFCHLPARPLEGGSDKKVPAPVELPPLDAVIGNPPYVRQELIPRSNQIRKSTGESDESYTARMKNSKDYLQELCSQLWPGLKLSGRSDLHCYF
ncbi:MAG: N-6 DNA methylase, partial [Planctomycetota bacterium]